MKHLPSARSLATLAFVTGAFAASSVAHADSDVYFSIGLQTPGVSLQWAPVPVLPPRHLYQPAARHDGRPDNGWRHDNGWRYDNGWRDQNDWRQGRQHWERRGPYGDRDRDGIANIHDPDSWRQPWRQARLYGPYGDLDRDGISNRYDRDRDGDGVRNRFDRLPDNPYRR